ncbi:hypothetical protein ACWKWP_06700 [Agromyces soli]
MSDPHWPAPGQSPWPPPQPGAAPPPASPAPWDPPAGTTPSPVWPAPEPQGHGAPPAYGAPQPQFAPPPPYGPSGYPPGQPGPLGWAPPPKPGLLPLRPLDFGALMWAPFRALRRNPGPVFGSGLLVQLVVALTGAAAFIPFFVAAFSRVEYADAGSQDEIIAGAVGGSLLLLLVPIALGIVGTAFLQGIMVVEVASGTLGEKLRFGELWRRTAKRIWPLIGWTLVVGAIVLVAVLLLVGVIIAGSLLGPGGLVGAIVFVLIAALGLVVLGAWLSVKLSLVPSAIVLEHAGLGAAVSRSWRLTDGYFWRTFGVEFLVALILNLASQVITTPFSLIGGIVIGLVDPTGTGSGAVVMIIVYLATIAISLVIGAVTAVVQSALIAVIYLDLRMRKEGLDLELARHVELRDAGVPVGDPYLPPAAPAAPAAFGAPTSWT